MNSNWNWISFLVGIVVNVQSLNAFMVHFGGIEVIVCFTSKHLAMIIKLCLRQNSRCNRSKCQQCDLMEKQTNLEVESLTSEDHV